MATSLTGRRVVVTRSPEDNAPLAVELRGFGAEIIDLPLTEVTSPADGGRALKAAVDRLAEYRYVTLTSANGVRAVESALAGHPWPEGVVVAPVGPVTAKLAVEAGMVVGPVPASATAADLVEGFPAWSGADVCRVLAPLAELAGDTVVGGLSDKGYAVDRVEAYRTMAPPPEQLAGGLAELSNGADAVLFFSPSAVDRFSALDQAKNGAVEDGTLSGSSPELAVCIGPSTAARAAEYSRWEVVVAEPHTEVGVIETLLEVLGCGEPTAQS